MCTMFSSGDKERYPIPGDVGYYQRRHLSGKHNVTDSCALQCSLYLRCWISGADVKGRVKKPKLDKDMAKLKVSCLFSAIKMPWTHRIPHDCLASEWQDLFAFCEDANFREVPVPAVVQCSSEELLNLLAVRALPF